MRRNLNLRKLVLSASKIETFTFRGPERVPTSLDITTFVHLKTLRFIGLTSIMRDGWLESVLGQLQCLEELQLVDCNIRGMLTSVFSESLRKLTLHQGDDRLVEFWVNAPKLAQFDLRTDTALPMKFFSKSGGCSGKITLSRGTLNDSKWFSLVRQSARYFDGWKEVTLSCENAQEMIIEDSLPPLSKGQIKPLRSTRHMRFQAGDMPRDNKNLTQLMATLTWLCPHPESLELYSLNTRRKRILIFEYGEQVTAWKSYGTCPVLCNCWRHYERKVHFEGFDGDDDEMRKCLTMFFRPTDEVTDKTRKTSG